MAGHQHLPESPSAIGALELAPRLVGQRLRQRGAGSRFTSASADDRQLAMVLRQVEMMDLVAEVILEREDARARIHRQPEREAPLRGRR